MVLVIIYCMESIYKDSAARCVRCQGMPSHARPNMDTSRRKAWRTVTTCPQKRKKGYTHMANGDSEGAIARC